VEKTEDVIVIYVNEQWSSPSAASSSCDGACGVMCGGDSSNVLPREYFDYATEELALFWCDGWVLDLFVECDCIFAG